MCDSVLDSLVSYRVALRACLLGFCLHFVVLSGG